MVLVVPPFRSVLLPALGASLLKANLLERGISSEILYLNLRFADRVGVHLYTRIEPRILPSTGEFIFSCVRFARTRDDIERYVREILVPSGEGRILSRLLSPRKLADAIDELVRDAESFCEEVVDEILARKASLVGFSSSVQENLASLSIASLLKRRDPSIRTVLGGANTQAEMGRELFAQFPELDYVAQGECDLSFVELVREHQEQRPPAPIPGILRRDLAEGTPRSPSLTVEQLESSPIPDFSDYFDQMRRLRHPGDIPPGLIAETARGCWWGAKQPCPFCGVAGENWAFRAKSVDRAVREINTLVERHGVRDLWVADLMLDLRQAGNLLSKLAESPRARLFSETAGALSKEQVRLLACAGVRHIQPGVESLSDRALRLMNKPTTALRNLQTLKWCGEAGVRTYWNYLCGMPGESDDEADQIEDLIRSVHHLQPPSEAHVVRVQRFSRYFEDASGMGFGECRPAPFYRHVYPFPADVLSRLAYHFEDQHTLQRVRSDGHRKLRKIIEEWRRHHRRSRLEIVQGRNRTWVLDTRPCALRRVRRLSKIEAELLLVCDAGHTLPELLRMLPSEVNQGTVKASLQSLIDARYVLELNDHFLSLATRPDRGSSQAQPFGGQLGRLGASEALRLVRRLHLTLLDMVRFAVLIVPDAFRLAKRGLAALWWNSFAWLAKRWVGAEREARRLSL